jgi:CRISPR-associated endonuclease/helicase Cas3
MGIEAREGEPLTVAQRFAVLPEKEKSALRMESPIGPLLLPAHLDALVQTNPTPAVEPDIALFLHGRREGDPDVQVVWRADLNSDNVKQWADIVSLCPPVASEAMQVPISAFRRWFDSTPAGDTDSDIEGVGGAEDEDAEASGSARMALRWRGERSEVVGSSSKVRPGDTLVLPASVGGFDELGHKTPDAKADIGDLARLIAKRLLTIRLHEEVWPELKAIIGRIDEKGIAAITDQEYTVVDPDLAGLLEKARGWRRGLKKLEEYPDRKDAWVVSGKGVGAGEDTGNDEPSLSVEVDLEQHLNDVTKAVEVYRELLGEKTDEYVWAARFHDCGKADIRFQALLRGGDIMAARFAPRPLAKSEWIPMGPAERKARRERSGLPVGFRHEMVSLLFSERMVCGAAREIGRHLIATHHGYARPLAPVVVDETGEPVSYGGVTLTVKEQREGAAHRLNSGVADRFWRLTRRYGWWGLAWYEALFRLADWEASGQSGKEKA